jgi:hypothetical protein
MTPISARGYSDRDRDLVSFPNGLASAQLAGIWVEATTERKRMSG